MLIGVAVVGGAVLVGAALGTGAAALGQALASKKSTPRFPKGDTYNYDLLQEGEVVYQGITKRPDERPEEHLLDGKIFDEVVYDEPKPRPFAKAFEAARLAEFRAENDGYNPIYNKTRSG